METQRLVVGAVFLASSLVGCATSPAPRPPAFALVATGEAGSGVRLYRSDHYRLYTTVADEGRVADVVATLESAFDAYVAVTGVRPAKDAPAMGVFLFARRAEWEAFTRARTGADAADYLRLARGGYTFGRFAALREQGDADTLTVLAHEGFHLFIATHFAARPPPFVEEGLATLFERARVEAGVATVDVGGSASRRSRLATLLASGDPVPLPTLLAMHAGDVIGLDGVAVDGFYAQAWAFARFLIDGENGRHHAAFLRMMADASTGALSGERPAEGPAIVERYLGLSLDELAPSHERFVRRLANRAAATPD